MQNMFPKWKLDCRPLPKGGGGGGGILKNSRFLGIKNIIQMFLKM